MTNSAGETAPYYDIAERGEASAQSRLPVDNENPELRTLQWMLREGVIGPGHFDEMRSGIAGG